MEKEVLEQPAWELETGLPNDIDGFISNPHFGTKDEYTEKVTASEDSEENVPVMFLFSLVDAKGEELAREQGYSVGTGWTIVDDGAAIEHPSRNNVVNNSRYGQLQKRVVKDLNVNMQERGLPTEAKSWAGLGFHWMLEEHATVGGQAKQSIMPTEHLGEIDLAKLGVKAKAAKAKVAPVDEMTPEMEAKLIELVAANDMNAFKIKAMRVKGVSDNDEIMADLLDESEDGFYVRHKE